MATTTVSNLTDASRVPPELAGRLGRLRSKLLVWLLVDGLSKLLLCLLVLIAIDLLIDWQFMMDRAQRAVMLVLALALLGYLAARWLLHPLRGRPSDEALCLKVEDHYRQLGETLISALEFSQLRDPDPRRMSPALVQATIDEGVERCRQVSFGDVLRSGRFARNLLVLASLLVALGGVGVAVAATETMHIWWQRNVLLGDRMWPQDTYFDVAAVRNGRAIIPRGDDWPLRVTVAPGSLVVPEQIRIDINAPGGQRTEIVRQLPAAGEQNRLAMGSDATEIHRSGGKFELMLNNVVEPFRFRVYSGRSTTAWITAELIDRPRVSSLTLTVRPPGYTGLPQSRLPPGSGPYYVLPGSELSISGAASKPLSEATVSIGQDRVRLSVADTRFQADLTADQVRAGAWTIDLLDTESVLLPGRDAPQPLASREPTQFGIKTQVDRRPAIQAQLVGVSNMVVPAARIPVAGRIADDFAVTAARLSYRWRNDQAGEVHQGELPLAVAAGALGGERIDFEHVLSLAELGVTAGSTLEFRIQAEDNDTVSGPKTGSSTLFPIRVVSEARLRDDLLRREKEQRQQLERLIQEQDVIRTETEALVAEARDASSLAPPQRELLAQLGRRQKRIGNALTAMAGRLDNIVVEMQNNGLEDEQGAHGTRLSEKVIAPLGALAERNVPESTRNLDRARRAQDQPEARDEALRQGAQTQAQSVERMREILRNMIRSEGFMEAVNLLQQVRKAQQEVLERTKATRDERIEAEFGSPPGGAKKPDSEKEPEASPEQDPGADPPSDTAPAAPQPANSTGTGGNDQEAN